MSETKCPMKTIDRASGKSEQDDQGECTRHARRLDRRVDQKYPANRKKEPTVPKHFQSIVDEEALAADTVKKPKQPIEKPKQPIEGKTPCQLARLTTPTTHQHPKETDK